MQIITPANAAFTPSGNANGGSIAISGSTTVAQNITADTSFGPVLLVTVPESGPYLVVLYAEVTNTTAVTGTLAANINNNGGPVASFSQSVTAPVAANDAQFVTVFTDLSFTFEWSVTGFTTGACDIKIIASVIKLF
jgi:hypothetical protein